MCKMVNTPFARIWYEYETRYCIRFTLILIRHSIFDSIFDFDFEFVANVSQFEFVRNSFLNVK